MISLRLTLFSAATATVMALATGPAHAHCPHKNNYNHPHCNGDGGGDPPPVNEPAVVVEVGRNSIAGEIRTFDTAAGSSQLVVKGDKEYYYNFPAWAPEGLHIALRTVERSSSSCLLSLRITTFDEGLGLWGTPQTLLCDRRIWDAEWGPTGGDGEMHRIYFTGDSSPDDEVSNWELARIDFDLSPDGSIGTVNEPVFLTPEFEVVSGFAVAPDGERIVLAKIPQPDIPGNDDNEIWLYDPDAIPEERLLLRAMDGENETFYAHKMAWHPSGTFITASISTDADGTRIFCIDPETGDAMVASSFISGGEFLVDHDPAWSPNGTHFYFRRNNAIGRVRFEDPPASCDAFVGWVEDAEDLGYVDVFLLPQGKITGYSELSARLP